MNDPTKSNRAKNVYFVFWSSFRILFLLLLIGLRQKDRSFGRFVRRLTRTHQLTVKGFFSVTSRWFRRVLFVFRGWRMIRFLLSFVRWMRVVGIWTNHRIPSIHESDSLQMKMNVSYHYRSTDPVFFVEEWRLSWDEEDFFFVDNFEESMIVDEGLLFESECWFWD